MEDDQSPCDCCGSSVCAERAVRGELLMEVVCSGILGTETKGTPLCAGGRFVRARSQPEAGREVWRSSL